MTVILTPDQRPYVLTALALIAGSCLTLAAHIRTRWLAGLGVGFLPAHAVTMGLVVAAGLAVLGPAGIVTGPALGVLAGIPAGVVCGLLIIPVDNGIARWFAARERSAAPRPRRPGGPPRAEGVRRVRPVSTSAGAPRRRTVGILKAKGTFVPSRSDYEVAAGWLLAVALLEELVFRGVLVRLALLAPCLGWQITGLAAGTVMFALSHVFFGWPQVVAKLPLAIIALALTLVTGSVFAAMAAHGLFNLYVWRYQNVVRIDFRESTARAW